jgi:hypothetical protein
MASSLRCEPNYRQTISFPYLYTFFFRPAGGNFQVELADNQAHTTLSFGGEHTSEYVNGATYDSSNPVRSQLFSSNNLFFSHFELYSTTLRA